MSDTRPEPAEQAGDAPASKPTSADQALASESVQLLDGTITGVDAHHYKVSVSLVGVPNPVQGVGYNPLAYIPKPDEHVLVAFVGPDVETRGSCGCWGSSPWACSAALPMAAPRPRPCGAAAARRSNPEPRISKPS